ncbi:MAG: hypothetical protein ACI9R3_002426 [Verrucomicrobiales bacterium]|jgi:hypothetical protein
MLAGKWLAELGSIQSLWTIAKNNEQGEIGKIIKGTGKKNSVNQASPIGSMGA